MARTVCGACAAILVLVSLFLWATAPANYLADDPTSAMLGWRPTGCDVAASAAESPIPGAAVLRVTSTSSDGAIDLSSRRLPAGPKTFSISLRSTSGEQITLRLHAYWQDNGGRQEVVRVGPEWRRYSLEIPADQAGRLSAGIGGQESFSKGKAIELAAPMVATGSSAPSRYSPAHLTDLGWLDWRAEDFRLRTGLRPLGWAAILVAMCWCLTFVGVRQRLFGIIGRYRTALGYVGIAAATWLGIEAVSFATCVVLATEKMPLQEAFREVWREGVTAHDGAGAVDAATTAFSPLTQIRRFVGAPDSEIGGRYQLPFAVNKLGLVDNDAPSPAWDVMPGKPPGMIRIILYGGSTAMGIGARDGTETVSAQLERMLNADAAPGTVFQVLNFGHGAAQSFTTLQFMSSMGAYLKPDVSIELDGFNDAFFATESDPTLRGLPYVMNWSNFSYYFDGAFNGIWPKPRPHVALLPFSSQLVGRLANDPGDRVAATKAYYDAMPARVLTEWLEKSGSSRADLLARNLRFIAGYFVHRDEYLLSYLQPHPWQFRKLMTVPIGNQESEKTRVEQWVGRGAAWPLTEYRSRMIGMFDAYAEVYRGLAKEYAEFGNIHFFDIRDLYEDFPKPAYQDIIHYTPAAQNWMAQRMYRDLGNVPVVGEHLRMQHGAATR